MERRCCSRLQSGCRGSLARSDDLIQQKTEEYLRVRVLDQSGAFACKLSMIEARGAAIWVEYDR